MGAEIFLGTILLEPNRWRPRLPPLLCVREWSARWAEAGFDGVELWERHHAEAAGSGVDWARLSPPVRIVSGYATWRRTPDAEAARARTLAVVAATGAGAVKFNFGAELERRDEELAVLREWARGLPAGTRLQCECHPRTLAEEPEAAADLLEELADLEPGAIVHFSAGTTETLRRWTRVLGARLRHVHVAARRPDGAHVALAAMPDAAERARVLRETGLPLSYTLEFVEGTGSVGETPEALWPRALADLARLRELV